ncbi:MAG TPA: SAM-dependent chlorinase/fluorinase [Candidatus Limnocylindria bacterium]|nr:SAM-dependent chlorinase/fluorinase [Candidatus Limnocylindria bacterium]
MRVIALVSDFGSRDAYAGAMKGVLATRAPEARVVDVTHDVPAGDIQHAAWVLKSVWRYFPDGTVFLAVVDPSVGTSRAAVALTADDRFGVGPDNGIFTFVAEGARGVTLPVPADASPVFHGRDVFAPVAAALAGGASLDDVGAPITSLARLPLPRPERRGDVIEAHVIHVDRFGNLVTDVPAAMLGTRPARVEMGAVRSSRFVRTYAEAKPGELVALVNSAAHLELATRDGSASERFGIRRGARLLVRIG